MLIAGDEFLVDSGAARQRLAAELLLPSRQGQQLKVVLG